jgi:small subunit ribosomal protein S2
MTLLKAFKTSHYSKNQIIFDHLFSYNSHIGATLSKRNPKVDEYLLGFDINNDTFFNLEKVIISLKRALSFLKCVSNKNEQILFIGTNNKTQGITKILGETLNQPYVSGRWVKGLLTNWENISSSIKLYDLFFKKLSLSKKKKSNLNSSLGGLKNLKTLPTAIVILDLKSDQEVVKEASRLNIPVIALLDNINSIDIDQIDFPIIINTSFPLSLFFVSSLIIQSLKK